MSELAVGTKVWLNEIGYENLQAYMLGLAKGSPGKVVAHPEGGRSNEGQFFVEWFRENDTHVEPVYPEEVDLEQPAITLSEKPETKFKAGDYARRKPGAGGGGYAVGEEPFRVVNSRVESRFGEYPIERVTDPYGQEHHARNLVSAGGVIPGTNTTADQIVELSDKVRKYLATEVSSAVRPGHYEFGGVQPIDIARHLPFSEGNVIKYVARAGRKNSEERLTDLRKAEQYLKWAIEDAEAEK